MNFILECQAIGLLVLLACASRTETPQAGIPDESIITVSLCQLTRDWEKYDHKIVRIGAIYHTGNEVSQFIRSRLRYERPNRLGQAASLRFY